MILFNTKSFFYFSIKSFLVPFFLNKKKAISENFFLKKSAWLISGLFFKVANQIYSGTIKASTLRLVERGRFLYR